MANPDFTLDGQGNEADSLIDLDGVAYQKAAGRSLGIPAGAGDPVATHLVEDATLFAGHGFKAVAVTSTAVALRGSSVPCKRITVKASVLNAATLYVGLTGVTNGTNNTTGGFQLSPGEGFTFGIDDVADVFINGTAGDGVSFAYEL